MSTLTGHLSLYATQSLRAIDDWMEVAQGNIGNSLRTASKGVELMYGGNLTHELKPTSATKNGVQIGEQVLTTGNTRVDWSQGEIIKSTQDTHFAINGDGFFLVADYPLRDQYNGQSETNLDNLYLTRDGSFHWSIIPAISSTDPVLVTEQGHLVMGEGSGLTTSNNHVIRILRSEFYGANEHKPAVMLPDYSGVGPGAGSQTVDLDELQYSKFGSTVLKSPTARSFKTIVNGNGNLLDVRSVGDTPGPTNLIQNALEASNIKVERNITELASMGKIYNGFVQLIKVYNSNLDEVLGFIR